MKIGQRLILSTVSRLNLLLLLFLLQLPGFVGGQQLTQPPPGISPNHLGSQANSPFQEAWDSGQTLSGLGAIHAGDVNNNGLLDFVGNRYQGTNSHFYLFESDNNGGYQEIWNSYGITPPCGAFYKFAYGDTDNDGLPEIIACTVSTNPRFFIFEKLPDSNEYALAFEYMAPGVTNISNRITGLHIADTNANSRKEIILTINYVGNSNFQGTLTILEYSGSGAEHSFENIFQVRPNIPIFKSELGDVDHDRKADLVMGTTGHWLNIWRYEYEPALGTWIEKSNEASPTGRCTHPVISDINGDGLDDLFYETIDPLGMVLVGSDGDDSFFAQCRTSDPIPGNSIMQNAAVPGAMLPLGNGAVGLVTYYGEIAVWTLSQFMKEFILVDSFNLSGISPNNLALADEDSDGRMELFISRTNQIKVWRQSNVDKSDINHKGVKTIEVRIYPNPFNPQTTVFFTLDRPGQTKVLAYDIQGRKVATLADEYFEIGDHSLVWQGRDSSGKAVPSGTYFFKIWNGNQSQIAKAALIR